MTTEQSDDYWAAVEAVAEAIANELSDDDSDSEEERSERLTQLVHEHAELHDYVINSDLQIQTLQLSNHPCAAFFNGTYRDNYQATDPFPFAAFAADAFEADVQSKLLQLLERA